MKAGALIEVEISSLGVIDRARFLPGPGLTVITGETGAGKTMVLSALSLLTGARADSSVIRSGCDRAHVVGRFAITDQLTARIEENGGEVEEGEVLFSRTIGSDGKSRAAIGGVSTTNSMLADLGAELVSIHGQSANFTLLKPSKAREILDQFGGKDISAPFGAYQALYQEYQKLLTTITDLKNLQSTREKEIVRINNFLTEFDRVAPKPRESEELRERILRLENVDSYRQALAQSLDLLAEGEESVSHQIAQIKRALEPVNESASNSESLSLVREISILVNELSSRLRNEEADLDVAPGDLEEMHSRRAQVVSLIKKHSDASLEDPESALIQQAKRDRALLAQLENGDQGLADLENECSRLAVKLLKSSEELTSARVEVAKKLEGEISSELVHLAMPGARIIVENSEVTDGLHVTANGKGRLCSPHGSDEIALLLIPHPGAHPLAINKGASGGELSRIMLAIEVVLVGRSAIPTYIFDEVDAGVGGKAAVDVGRRLAKLAHHAQVLVVTHLPQVAAWADTHYSIRKNSSERITSSDLALIEGEERALELARMMAGREESESAQEHARELLEFVASERALWQKKSSKRA